MRHSDFYYRGFIAACTSRGLEKQAADELYKEAQWWVAVGKGLGHAFNAARQVGQWTAKVGTKAKDIGTAVGHAAQAVGRGAVQAGRAGKAYVGRAGRSMATGFGQVVPPVTRLAWSNMLGIGKSNFLPRVGNAVTNLRRPFTAATNFVGKHPIIGTLGAMGVGAYLTNKANQASMADQEKAKMRALTPSEKAMYDRYDSGMNLPGLGLDPSYFNGGTYNSFM